MLLPASVRKCIVCEELFEHQKFNAKVCSVKCQSSLKRLRGKITFAHGVPHSGVPGITWDTTLKSWRVKDKKLYLGVFKDLKDAHDRLGQHRYLKSIKRCNPEIAKAVYAQGKRGKLKC